MIDSNKINQVFEAIIENGIDAFSDNDLIKLFSMLNKQELNELYEASYDIFNKIYDNSTVTNIVVKRIDSIIKIVKIKIDTILYKIKNGTLINSFYESLKQENYQKFIVNCSTNELSDLKYYLYNNVNTNDKDIIKVNKKIINIIIKELKNRVGKLNKNDIN